MLLVSMVLLIKLTVNNILVASAAKDFYLRLNEHLANKKSNVYLQNAINKYGLDNFY